MTGHVSDFFQRLSISLEIEVSEDYYHPTMTMMRFASPGARVLAVQPLVGRYTADDIVELGDREWASLAYDRPEITLANNVHRTFRAASDDGFTVRELVDAICAFEKEDRAHTDWFGGVDVHAVFFEGLERDGDAWRIVYGS